MIIPSKFAEFSSFLGLPMLGFEKKITTLFKKMKARKGRGVKVSRGGSTSLSSHLEREI